MDPFFSSRKFDPSELRNTLMSLPTQHEVDTRSPRNSLGNIEVTTEITTQNAPRHVKERTRSYPFSLSAANRQASHRRDHSADDAKPRSKSYSPLSTNEKDTISHHQNVQPTKLSRKTVRFSLEDYRNKNKKRGEVTSCSSDNSSRYTFTFADKPLPTAPERSQSVSSQGSANGSLNAAKRLSTSGPLKLLTHSFSSSSRRQSMTPISPQTQVDSLTTSLTVEKRQSIPTFSSLAAKRQSSLLNSQSQIVPPSSGFVAPRRQSSLAIVQQAVTSPDSSSFPTETRREKSTSIHVQHKPLPPPPTPEDEKPSPILEQDNTFTAETSHGPAPEGDYFPSPLSETFSRDLPPSPGKTPYRDEPEKRDSVMEESWMEDISEEEAPLVASQEDDMMESSARQEEPSQTHMPEGDILIELDMPDDETVDESTSGHSVTELITADQITQQPHTTRLVAQVEDAPEETMDDDVHKSSFFEDETQEEGTIGGDSVADDMSEGDMTEEEMDEDNVDEEDMIDPVLREQETADQEMPDESVAGQEIAEDITLGEDLPQDKELNQHALEAGPPGNDSSEMTPPHPEIPTELAPQSDPPKQKDQENDTAMKSIPEESEVTESSSQEEVSAIPSKAQIMSCQRLTITSFRTPPLLQWSHRRGIRQLGTRYRAIPKHHCEEIVMQITSYIPRRVAVQLHYIRPGWKILRCRLKVPVVLILVPSSRRVPQRVYSLLCVGQGREPGEEIMAGIDLEKIDRGKRRMRLEADMRFCEK